MLTRIRRSIEDKDQGFTLIELLVVMIIIGVLAAIAIPLYISQRTKGYEATAKSDAQAIATDVAGAVINGVPSSSIAVTTTPSAPVSSVTTLSTAINTTDTLNSKISGYDQVKLYVDTAGNWCVSAKNSQGGNAWVVMSTNGLQTATNGCTGATTKT